MSSPESGGPESSAPGTYDRGVDAARDEETGPDDERIAGEVRATVAATVRRLAEAGVRDEALARYIPSRRVLLIPRPSVMEPIARVWRLGALLLARDGRLFATGSITRATEPGRSGYQSQSAEVRREYRAAAFRGRFAAGEAVNYDAVEIGLGAEALRSSKGPVILRADGAAVLWSAAASEASAIPFAAYLGERAELLLNPPQGA